ncbi:MAG: hypothetical protein ACXVEF_30865 [Polyangiales bacterium]
MNKWRELLESRRTEQATAVADAEAAAAKSGKERFDFARFRVLCHKANPDRATEAEHRYEYYVGHPELTTMMEYVVYLERQEPWADSR